MLALFSAPVSALMKQSLLLRFVLPLIACRAHAAVIIDGSNSISPPRNGTQVLNANGFYLRLVSDSGNILAVKFSGTGSDGLPLGFFGKLGQVWTAPNGDGNYTQATPGFRTESGTPSSPYNFDSHFLGNPANFVIDEALQEGNVLFPNGNTIPSDSFTGYGYGGSVSQPGAGFLTGSYEVALSAQNAALNFAYIVVGPGGGFLRGDVLTEGGTFRLSAGLSGPIPEPAPLGLTGLASLLLIRGRRCGCESNGTRRDQIPLRSEGTEKKSYENEDQRTGATIGLRREC
jgi:hypothetical protein